MATLACDWHFTHDEDMRPTGDPCGEPAVECLYWDDGQSSFACAIHGPEAMDPAAAKRVIGRVGLLPRAQQIERMSNVTTIPEPGDWPCETAPAVDPPARLLATIYRILRDYVQPGDLEQIMLDISMYDPDTKVAYTNPHLEAYARSLCAFLLAGSGSG